MATKTQSVTFVSKFRKFRFGNHQFVNGRLTLTDPNEIKKLDDYIQKGGPVSFTREPVGQQSASAEAANRNLDPYDWSQHTVAELKGHAANADLKFDAKATKQELVDALSKTEHRPG